MSDELEAAYSALVDAVEAVRRLEPHAPSGGSIGDMVICYVTDELDADGYVDGDVGYMVRNGQQPAYRTLGLLETAAHLARNA